MVLRKLRRCIDAAREIAISHHVPEAHQVWFRQELVVFTGIHLGVGTRRNAGGPAVDTRDLWASALTQRQRHGIGWSAAAKKVYRSKVLADRARGRNRMGQPHVCVQRNAPITNEAALPAAKRSTHAELHEHWCKFNSWSMCEDCKMLQLRNCLIKH